eukprot:1148596-Pelagomonas_calceolata.AAC.5
MQLRWYHHTFETSTETAHPIQLRLCSRRDRNSTGSVVLVQSLVFVQRCITPSQCIGASHPRSAQVHHTLAVHRCIMPLVTTQRKERGKQWLCKSSALAQQSI